MPFFACEGTAISASKKGCVKRADALEERRQDEEAGQESE
jgi:hypothetical protein